MLKAIAIDDEPLALEVIAIYCSELDYITLERSFTSIDNAKKYLNKFDVDVIFLDIEMPKANGIDFYKSITKNVKVIFTTAHSKYAVEGFRVNASDYLLKPIALEQFIDATKRVLNEVALLNSSEKENTHISIRANYKLHNVSLSKIQYIEAMDDYVKLYIEDEKTLVTRSTMKGILSKLPPSKFIRVHKSFIVPVDHINIIKHQSLIINNIEVPIGQSYKKNLERFF